MLGRILIISKHDTVITRGKTHLGILPWIAGIIGLLQSHFDVNNISNFPVILHWSSAAEFCPEKQLKIECLKLEMWRVHFIQVVRKTALPERCNIIGIDSVPRRRQFLSTTETSTWNGIHTRAGTRHLMASAESKSYIMTSHYAVNCHSRAKSLSDCLLSKQLFS